MWKVEKVSLFKCNLPSLWQFDFIEQLVGKHSFRPHGFFALHGTDAVRRAGVANRRCNVERPACHFVSLVVGITKDLLAVERRRETQRTRRNGFGESDDQVIRFVARAVPRTSTRLVELGQGESVTREARRGWVDFTTLGVVG